jgi:glycosyltransferase involved in cell wall biosynthesis
MNRVPDITLSICTRDRPEELLKTLEVLREVRCTAAWELLVVDNGREDAGLRERAGSLGPFSACEMRWVREPRPGVSHARNLALESARGKILVFIDDDVDCAPRFLEEHFRAFSDPAVHATGGRIVPRLPAGSPAWLVNGIEQEIGGPTARYDFGDRVQEILGQEGVRPGLSLPVTCNCGLRRGLALQVGGFRTDLGWTADGKRIGGEDTELFSRIGKLGGRMLYLPHAKVVHRIREERVTRSYFRQWNIAYGRASVRMKERPGLWKGLGIVCEQLVRYVRYAWVPARWLRDPVLERTRKKYRAAGKILEILRFP